MGAYFKHKLRVISILTLLSFAAHDAAWAAPGLSAPAPAASAAMTAPAPIGQFIATPQQLDIPLDAVTLQEVHAGTNGKLIIHIQDAHANLSGQQSLAKALDHLMSRYDLQVVLVEGSARNSSLTEIRKLAPLKEWKIIARRFLYEGIISGEEYLNLTTEHPMKILGIEYRDLYDESIKAYAALVDRRKDILHYLYQSKVSLDRLKQRFYPQNLKDYEAKKGTDDLAGVDFKNGFSNLLKLAEEARYPLEGMPNAVKLRGLLQEESSLNFDRANAEQQKVLESVSASGGRESVKEFVEQSKRLRHSQVSQYLLIEKLFKTAEERQIAIDAMPELRAYKDYLAKFAGLNLEALLAELDLLEDKVYEKLLPNGDARKVRAIDRFLGLLGNAYKLQMSSRDFGMLTFNEKDFPTESWLAFMNQKLAELGFFQSMLPYKNYLEEARADFSKFYTLVGQRDQAFVENANRLMAENNTSAAVLIAGGYHTAHLTELLRAEGTSYVVLTPVVTDTTDHEKYEELLLQHLRAQERRLSSKKDTAPYRAQNVAQTRIPRGLRMLAAIYDRLQNLDPDLKLWVISRLKDIKDKEPDAWPNLSLEVILEMIEELRAENPEARLSRSPLIEPTLKSAPATVPLNAPSEGALYTTSAARLAKENRRWTQADEDFSKLVIQALGAALLTTAFSRGVADDEDFLEVGDDEVGDADDDFNEDQSWFSGEFAVGEPDPEQIADLMSQAFDQMIRADEQEREEAGKTLKDILIKAGKTAKERGILAGEALEDWNRFIEQAVQDAVRELEGPITGIRLFSRWVELYNVHWAAQRGYFVKVSETASPEDIAGLAENVPYQLQDLFGDTPLSVTVNDVVTYFFVVEGGLPTLTVADPFGRSILIDRQKFEAAIDAATDDFEQSYRRMHGQAPPPEALNKFRDGQRISRYRSMFISNLTLFHYSDDHQTFNAEWQGREEGGTGNGPTSYLTGAVQHPLHRAGLLSEAMRLVENGHLSARWPNVPSVGDRALRGFFNANRVAYTKLVGLYANLKLGDKDLERVISTPALTEVLSSDSADTRFLGYKIALILLADAAGLLPEKSLSAQQFLAYLDDAEIIRGVSKRLITELDEIDINDPVAKERRRQLVESILKNEFVLDYKSLPLDADGGQLRGLMGQAIKLEAGVRNAAGDSIPNANTLIIRAPRPNHYFGMHHSVWKALREAAAVGGYEITAEEQRQIGSKLVLLIVAALKVSRMYDQDSDLLSGLSLNLIRETELQKLILHWTPGMKLALIRESRKVFGKRPDGTPINGDAADAMRTWIVATKASIESMQTLYDGSLNPSASKLLSEMINERLKTFEERVLSQTDDLRVIMSWETFINSIEYVDLAGEYGDNDERMLVSAAQFLTHITRVTDGRYPGHDNWLDHLESLLPKGSRLALRAVDAVKRWARLQFTMAEMLLGVTAISITLWFHSNSLYLKARFGKDWTSQVLHELHEGVRTNDAHKVVSAIDETWAYPHFKSQEEYWGAILAGLESPNTEWRSKSEAVVKGLQYEVANDRWEGSAVDGLLDTRIRWYEDEKALNAVLVQLYAHTGSSEYLKADNFFHKEGIANARRILEEKRGGRPRDVNYDLFLQILRVGAVKDMPADLTVEEVRAASRLKVYPIFKPMVAKAFTDYLMRRYRELLASDPLTRMNIGTGKSDERRQIVGLLEQWANDPSSMYYHAADEQLKHLPKTTDGSRLAVTDNVKDVEEAVRQVESAIARVMHVIVKVQDYKSIVENMSTVLKPNADGSARLTFVRGEAGFDNVPDLMLSEPDMAWLAWFVIGSPNLTSPGYAPNPNGLWTIRTILLSYLTLLNARGGIELGYKERRDVGTLLDRLIMLYRDINDPKLGLVNKEPAMAGDLNKKIAAAYQTLSKDGEQIKSAVAGLPIMPGGARMAVVQDGPESVRGDETVEDLHKLTFHLDLAIRSLTPPARVQRIDKKTGKPSTIRMHPSKADLSGRLTDLSQIQDDLRTIYDSDVQKLYGTLSNLAALAASIRFDRAHAPISDLEQDSDSNTSLRFKVESYQTAALNIISALQNLKLDRAFEALVTLSAKRHELSIFYEASNPEFDKANATRALNTFVDKLSKIAATLPEASARQIGYGARLADGPHALLDDRAKLPDQDVALAEAVVTGPVSEAVAHDAVKAGEALPLAVSETQKLTVIIEIDQNGNMFAASGKTRFPLPRKGNMRSTGIDPTGAAELSLSYARSLFGEIRRSVTNLVRRFKRVEQSLPPVPILTISDLSDVGSSRDSAEGHARVQEQIDSWDSRLGAPISILTTDVKGDHQDLYDVSYHLTPGIPDLLQAMYEAVTVRGEMIVFTMSSDALQALFKKLPAEFIAADGATVQTAEFINKYAVVSPVKPVAEPGEMADLPFGHLRGFAFAGIKKRTNGDMNKAYEQFSDFEMGSRSLLGEVGPQAIRLVFHIEMTEEYFKALQKIELPTLARMLNELVRYLDIIRQSVDSAA